MALTDAVSVPGMCLGRCVGASAAVWCCSVVVASMSSGGAASIASRGVLVNEGWGGGFDDCALEGGGWTEGGERREGFVGVGS